MDTNYRPMSEPASAGLATNSTPAAITTSQMQTSALPSVAPPITENPPQVLRPVAPAPVIARTGGEASKIVPVPAANDQISSPGKNLRMPAPEERRDASQNKKRSMGHVISCDGARVIIKAAAVVDGNNNESTEWAIGRLISISVGESRIVGLVYKLQSDGDSWSVDGDNNIIVMAELQGEVLKDEFSGRTIFRKGISNYPHVGAIAHRIRVADLKIIYENSANKCASIGSLSQDSSVDAMIAVEDVISKHFAILGSTGCGKSSATSLILHRIQEQLPDLRILILDPHNEYYRGFRDTAAMIDINTLELPHWLFQLDEFAEVLFRGDPSTAQERDALRELVPAAKAMYSQSQEGMSLRRVSKKTAATADTPVPYKMSDLLAVIEEQIGLLESPMKRPILKSLKARIESLANDPKFRFMFSSRMVTDNAIDTLGKIFRIPDEGKPVSILHMAEIPGDVVSSLVSVLCRLAFDLTAASEGQLKVLIVCEEAHRYIPEDKNLGFAPARNAIARIAKEGRKYGTYLCIISQRPGELDPTILSQCSTLFSLRLSNETDQDIVRKAISASSASTISFLSSIGNREAIAFGEGLSTPMRMRFSNLPNEWLLGHETAEKQDQQPDETVQDMTRVLSRWRLANQM